MVLKSVNLPLVVTSASLPDVRAISLSAYSFLAAPVVIVKYRLSVKNSSAHASAVVINEPEVNFKGAVLAEVVPAAMCSLAVGVEDPHRYI